MDFPHDDADALLAQAMAAMSVDEREQSIFDVHGVSDVIHEEPSFVRAKLEDMEMELSKITRGKEGYMQAEAQNKEYVICHKFRLKFLRAEIFNARLAAVRLVRFFEEKKKLFGPDKLTKEIKLRDLDKEDRKFLDRGVFQIVPQRDRAGRRIIIWMPMMIRGESDPNRERGEESSRKKMRALYYLMMAASEDEETQKRGMVGIFVNVGKNRVVTFEGSTRKVPSLTRSLPFRWAAFHFCVNDAAFFARVAIDMVMRCASHLRARFKKHEGSWQEICYSLMSFGLPVDAFPIKHNEHDFSLDNHKDWLSRREKLEALDNNITSDDTDERINEPGPLDVVQGRGWKVRVHPGNLRFRNIIAERQKVYDKSLIYEKTLISKEIVQVIKESGGRFLRQDEGHGWKLVDDNVARVKVSAAFRDRRKSNSVPPINAANEFLDESDFARLHHSLDEGVLIDPSDTKRLKTSPSA